MKPKNHIITSLFLFIFLIIASSCAQLSPGGRMVRFVTERQKNDKCEFIGTVTGYGAFCPGCAINSARNKIANMGGNGIKIVSNVSNEAGDTNVYAEAFNCEF